MLELDLVLQRFLDERFEQLSSSQREALARLLNMPDNDLLDAVMGRAEIEDAACAEIVAMLR